MAQLLKNLRLVEHFQKYMHPADWSEAIDIFQDACVSGVEIKDSIVLATVTIKKHLFEVRMRIHPASSFIQWIECSCRKRSKGSYCEHIGAFMIFFDQKQSALLEKMDRIEPILPPHETKKTISFLKETYSEDQKLYKILQLFEQNITKVSLLNKGPQLVIEVQIPNQNPSHYELTIDESAFFLSHYKGYDFLKSTVEKLTVEKSKAILGFYIYYTDETSAVVQKYLAIPMTSEKWYKTNNIAKSKYELRQVKTFLKDGKKLVKQSMLLIPASFCKKYIGQKFIFLPKQGYWPIDTEKTYADWHNYPLKKKYKNSDLGLLVHSKFSQYLNISPVWLDDELESSQAITLDKISSLKIHAKENNLFCISAYFAITRYKIDLLALVRKMDQANVQYVKHNIDWIKIPLYLNEIEIKIEKDLDLIHVPMITLLQLRAMLNHSHNIEGPLSLLAELDPNLGAPEVHPIPKYSHNRPLRNYQVHGLRWLWWLYRYNLSGLLADEMGLGKTHQAICLLSAIRDLHIKQTEKNKKDLHFLIICPTSVIDHWIDKIKHFCPSLTSLRYHGSKRHELLKEALKNSPSCTLITTYGVLIRDQKILKEINWEVLILDEAHYIKNEQTSAYSAAKQLSAKFRLALSGTPIENHLFELKNLFDFLVPTYLGSPKYFKNKFMFPIERNENPEIKITLQKLLYPLKLRRKKDDVLSDLPKKIEDKRICQMSSKQRKIYQKVLNEKVNPLIQRLDQKGEAIPYLHVFAVLQILKQVCDHPKLLSNDMSLDLEVESGKFELLKELIFEALESEAKIVIFSQYLQMIQIISHYCKQEGIEHVCLTGKTTKRKEVIEKFQTDPNCKIFIGSLLAGGVGIDLTAASIVIHYDRWWNPSKEDQATDRVHRIGQNKCVQVFKLITQDSIEERIDKIISRKQGTIENFLERDEEVFRSLTKEDLISLMT